MAEAPKDGLNVPDIPGQVHKYEELIEWFKRVILEHQWGTLLIAADVLLYFCKTAVVDKTPIATLPNYRLVFWVTFVVIAIIAVIFKLLSPKDLPRNAQGAGILRDEGSIIK